VLAHGWAAAAVGQLAREAEFDSAQVAPVRPGGGVVAVSLGAEARAAAATRSGHRRREQRERVLRVERAAHRLREAAAARVRVEAVALAAAVDEGAGVEGRGADAAPAAVRRHGVVVGEREGAAGARVREVLRLPGAVVAGVVEDEGAAGVAAAVGHLPGPRRPASTSRTGPAPR